MTTDKTGEKVLIVKLLNAIYVTMVASLIYYKKFVKTLHRNGLQLNTYDTCVANRICKLQATKNLLPRGQLQTQSVRQ